MSERIRPMLEAALPPILLALSLASSLVVGAAMFRACAPSVDPWPMASPPLLTAATKE